MGLKGVSFEACVFKIDQLLIREKEQTTAGVNTGVLAHSTALRLRMTTENEEDADTRKGFAAMSRPQILRLRFLRYDRATVRSG
jgi:hypothetical protein